MELIVETAQLKDLCAALSHDAFITVDTEFLRESTYWSELCLIQIAGETVNGLIDPLAKDMDLAPFFALMDNPKVLKVFHAARQDVEIFVHRAGTVPHPIFDTQIAAMVCGFGDQVSYEGLVRKLAGAQIDKSSRFTDWSRRPLTEKQLSYALSDVTHLRTVYNKLKTELDATGREPWLRQEMDILMAIETYRTHPEDAWKRIKVRLRSKKQLAVLMSVAAWREVEAQEKNVPRGRVVKDDALAEIATQMPQTKEALGQLRALPRGHATSKIGDSILKAVKQGLSRDLSLLPDPAKGRDDSSDQTQAAADILKLALKVICEREGLAPKLVASATDIEALAEDDNADVEANRGWRKEVFGKVALDLKHGRSMIGLRSGKAVIVPSG